MNRDLLRRHLDEHLCPLREPLTSVVPARGWIRTVREALGMSLAELARRMGSSKGSVAQAERAELDGSITIRRLRSLAAALDCDVHVVLIPRTSLQDTMLRETTEAVSRRFERAGYLMELEGQGVSRERVELLVREQVANQLARGKTPWE